MTADYRAYIIGSDGRIKSFETFVCKDDDDAVAAAERLVDGHDIEVWNGARLVFRLPKMRET
jgi:hypothetical protein